MTFTEEQREALALGAAVPMTIDGIECIVVRADAFSYHDELRKVLSRSVEGSDWLHPDMDIYEYDLHRAETGNQLNPENQDR
jgi:hypothetical protein